MKGWCVFLAFLFASPFLSAQKCGHTEYMRGLEVEYPGLAIAAQKTFEAAQLKSLEKSTAELLRVPVVVHVVYNNESENLSEALILEQIDILNKDFQRLNEDATMTRDTFLNIVGNPEIEFYLADIDPAGQPTNGITRTETAKTSFLEDLDIENLEDVLGLTEDAILGSLNKIKSADTDGQDAWDTTRYLNIWVGDMSVNVNNSDLPILLGFAFPPVGAPNWPDEIFIDDLINLDGVVIHYEAFGVQSGNPFLDGVAGLGRALSHEVGHYFGLRHIWGDGDCSMDDGLDDTPVAAANSQPTAIGALPSCEAIGDKDSCTDDLMPDMIENFMDYSLEVCQNAFTADQASLMRAMLNGPRSGLLEQFVPSGISESYGDWEIFPNPGNDYIKAIGVESLGAIRIYNIQGQLLNTSKHTGDVIYIANLEEGVYFLAIQSGQQSVVKRFVVQR